MGPSSNRHDIKKVIYTILAAVLVISWCACSTIASEKKKEKKRPVVLIMDSLYTLSRKYLMNSEYGKCLPITRQGIQLATNDNNDSMIAKFCGQMEQVYSLQEHPNKDSTDHYHHLMLKHALLSKNKKLLFIALEYKKRLFGRAGRFDSVINITNERLDLAKAMNDSISILEMEEELGNCYQHDIENIGLAYEHYTKALELCLLLKKNNTDPDSDRAKKIRIRYIVLLYDIADLFTSQKNYTKGLGYYEELNRIIPESRKPHNPALFVGLAECYEGLKQPDSAIKYYKTAINFSSQPYFKDHHQRASKKFGALLIRQGKQEGGAWLQKALQAAWQMNRPELILDSRLALGAYYILQQHWVPASDTLRAALQLAKTLKKTEDQVTAYQQLSLLNEQQGNYKAALDYSKLARKYDDSTQADNFAKLATEMDAKYKAYQNDQQIILLQKDNRIQQLQLQTSRRTRIFYISGAIALLSIGGLVYYYRSRQQRTKHNKVKVELENKALRAQMNPHFIFNSLNAIQELIVTENYPSSYEYLSKFSRLLRMVLHNSEKNFVLLSQEIEMYHLYLDLESLRFKHAFSYTISVSQDLEADNLLFPTLLAQPFIENAIWHGLLQKEGEKLLAIHFEEKEGNLVCTITDNGIGREKAARIKQGATGANHFGSKGISLAQQRIEAMGSAIGKQASLHIGDRKNAANEPCGTTVAIQIPLIENI